MLIPQNKAIEISSKTTTGAGFETFRIDLEQAAGIFTLNVSDVNLSGRYAIRAYEVGNTPTDRILKYDSGTRPSSMVNPLQFEVTAGGGLEIEFEYTEAIVYTLRGRSKGFVKEIDSVSVTESAAISEWRTDVETSLSEINDKLQRLLIHMSIITGMDEDC